ncbi:MAG: methyl-accepting chemotaxis protein [Gemmatimonadaceae bacterium]
MMALIAAWQLWEGVPYAPARLYWTLGFMFVAVGSIVFVVRRWLRGSVLADIASTLGIFLLIIGVIVYAVAFRGLRTGEVVFGWIISAAAIAWVVGRLNTLARRPIAELERVGLSIRRGDWNSVLEDRSPTGQSFASALQQVATLIAETQRATERVTAASAEAARIGHEVREGAGRTSAVLDVVRRGSSDAAKATTQIADVAGQLIDSAGSLHTAATETRAISRAVEERAQTGVQTAGAASATISTLAGAARDLAQRMGELRGATDTVAEIATAVSSISDQTKLLALNASIEAARAGIHGAGFAVVAEEVGKLATESASSLSRIEDLARQMTARAATAQEAAHEVERSSADGERLMHETMGALRDIEEKLRRTHELAENVVTASGRQADLARDLNSAAGAIVQAARAAADSSQDAAGVSAQQLTLTDDLTSTASTLEETAGSLAQVVARFGQRT